MSISPIHPVILCGGGGSRLWPLSRPHRPKPFLDLLGGPSLFERTLSRCAALPGGQPPILVSGEAHLPLVLAQSRGNARIIAEPMGRSTAPAIALAALRLEADALMLVCPSDHHIADESAFASAVDKAAALAREDWLVTFGIATTRAETGFGYLERGDALAGGYRVARFVEKPDAAAAASFHADPCFSWNGGIFLLRAGAFLDALARYRPAMAEAVALAVARGEERDGIFRPDTGHFAAIEGESIDYAVMENSDRVAMVEADMGWSDIGNWSALADARAAMGRPAADGRHETLDCENVTIVSDGPRVSAVGLSGVTIVVDGDEVLVTSAQGAARVGQLRGAKGRPASG